MRLATLLVMFLGISVLNPSFTRAQGIPWLDSPTEAATEAEKAGKPILVYVRSANCKYCDMMQENTWSNPMAVMAVSQFFVPLKLTKEQNPKMIEALQVKGFPATLIFTPGREYHGRLDGYMEPAKFLNSLQAMRPSGDPGTVRR